MTELAHGNGWKRLAEMPEVLTPGPPRDKAAACIPGIGRVHYVGRSTRADRWATTARDVIATDDTGQVYVVRLSRWLSWPA